MLATCVIEQVGEVARVKGKSVPPTTVPAIRIHGCDPTLRCGPLYLHQLVVTLRFEDEVNVVPFESDKEIREVIVILSVVSIWNGEVETGILHPGIHLPVTLDVVGT